MTQAIIDDLKAVQEQNQFESICKRLKSAFKNHFEGCGDWCDYEIDSAQDPENTDLFQIHAFDFNFDFLESLSTIEMTVKLGRPWLLIGKGGSRVEALCKYLSNQIGHRVILNIVEYDIWK